MVGRSFWGTVGAACRARGCRLDAWRIKGPIECAELYRRCDLRDATNGYVFVLHECTKFSHSRAPKTCRLKVYSGRQATSGDGRSLSSLSTGIPLLWIGVPNTQCRLRPY